MSNNKPSLEELDLAYVWHPFTQFSEWAKSPLLVIDKAEGCELYDSDGRAYLDAVGSLWVGVHGHRHPAVDAAVKHQLSKVAHSTFLGLSHAPGIELARRLVELSPGGLNRVFYSDSGSTAVEVALKMAFQCQQQRGETRRTRFVSLTHAYHGDTVGSVSVGGIDLFHGVYKPLLFDALHLESPDHYEDESGLVDRAIELMNQESSELVALVVEPLVQGAAGMRMHSIDFIEPILRHARSLGALIVFDEVATGFGRTGTLFAADQISVKPDLMCLGKGLTNGYLPLAVTLATESVFEAFSGSHEKTFFHGHTYTANPLGCAAALATLDLFEQENTMENARIIEQIMKELLPRLEEHVCVLKTRQKGLMIGIDLCASNGELLPSKLRTGHKVCMRAREKGVIYRPLGDTIVMMPPLCMNREQLIRLVDVLTEVLDEMV